MLEFEQAAEFRDIYNYCQNFARRQKFMLDFMDHNILIVSKSNKQYFLFFKGEMLKGFNKKPSKKYIWKLLADNINKEDIPPSYLMERAYVVWVWLKQKRATYSIVN